jgi:hypothetical protein
MNLTWLKDYGALVAASIAAAVTVVNGFMQARRDRRSQERDWLRSTRMPRYVAFLEIALEYRQAIFGQLGEWDSDLGVEPKEWPDYHKTGDAFRHALSSVQLVGPAAVAEKAQIVQYSMWEYEARLEGNPYDFDQRASRVAIEDYLAACRSALELPTDPAGGPIDYRHWKKLALPGVEH